MSTAAEVLDECAQPLTEGEMVAAEGVAGEAAQEVRGELASEKSATLFYGWLMLPLAMLMMVATSPGQTFGFSFFNAKFREAFELTQTRLSATYLVATVIASLALPYIGGLIDRFGLRRSSLVGVVALAGVCVFMSQAQGVVMLFAAFVMFRVLGPGTLVLLANNTLAVWFDRRLGFVSGVMQVAMAGAMAFVPAGVVFLIDSFGWRGAYLGIAAVLTCGLLPLLALFYRDSPSALGQFPDGERPALEDKNQKLNAVGLTPEQAMRQQAFWILLASAAIWALIGTGFVFHLEAIFQNHGLGKFASTRAMTCMAICMGVAQVLGGLLADRLPLRVLVVSAIGLIATSCFLLAAGKASILIASFCVYGVGQGLMTIVSATGWARYFGRTHLGKIRGMSLTGAIAGSSLGPLLMGVSDDYLGGFEPAYWLFAAVASLIAIAGFWAKPPAPILPSDESVALDA